MLNIKEFEKALKSVTQDEINKKKVRGQYVPYIEAIIRKARLLPVGRSVEVDIQDPKKAAALASSMKTYLKKLKMETLVAGNYKGFVFRGKRTEQKSESKNGGK